MESLHEFNPMLGHRGCRLGIVYPEITRMQVTAIVEAACQLGKEGVRVVPEIMIPLVGHVNELRNQKNLVDETAAEVMKRTGVTVRIPRRDDDRASARGRDGRRDRGGGGVLSFGTNDLTQTTFGFSRDDAEVHPALHRPRDPGERPVPGPRPRGRGSARRNGRGEGAEDPAELKVGICGEHGGEPSSIEFCHGVGLDYVSCSPYRVPIARVAAAQASIRERGGRRSARIKDRIGEPAKR